MAEERVQRRLAAILAADVVGYSRLLEQDEAKTLATLKTLRRDVLNPLLTKHCGRVVKVMGDGVLVEFGSAVNAVACASELQKRIAVASSSLAEDRRIVLRIGVSLGDLVVEGGDLYGDGVIIAVRLQAMAEPGTVCIAGAVHDQVANKLSLAFEDLGPCEVKNIARPVRVFRVLADSNVQHSVYRQADQSKSSIAVLPFANMSGDAEQEYFSDGITEDIITDLSEVSALNVVSRSTAFSFKGKPIDVAQIAKRLRVGHILEGSVRKSGGRVRITAQLIDATKDRHVWSKRYDRDVQDIFVLQDEIAQSIVAALKVRLLPAEKKAIEKRSTRDPRAYEIYLQGRYHYRHYGPKNLQIAIRSAKRALEIDPQYASAWAMIASCQSSLRIRGLSNESGLAAAEMALRLDPALAEAHSAMGRVLGDLGRFEEAVAAFEEALRLDPGSLDAHFNFGRACHLFGRYEEAIGHFEYAASVGDGYGALSYMAQIYRALGREDEAADAARRALEEIEKEVTLHPDNALALSFGVGLLVQLGDKERALEWISRTLIVEPDDPITHHNLACNLAQMGDAERALDLLESSNRKMSASAALPWIKNDSDLVPLHGHPRYEMLIADAEARFAAVQSEQPEVPD